MQKTEVRLHGGPLDGETAELAGDLTDIDDEFNVELHGRSRDESGRLGTIIYSRGDDGRYYFDRFDPDGPNKVIE